MSWVSWREVQLKRRLAFSPVYCSVRLGLWPFLFIYSDSPSPCIPICYVYSKHWKLILVVIMHCSKKNLHLAKSAAHLGSFCPLFCFQAFAKKVSAGSLYPVYTDYHSSEHWCILQLSSREKNTFMSAKCLFQR